ncbi:HAMP domain-containing sensor histidine kinase [Flavicella sp.]|uniref:sensor histidine kinase n=1 Tax=Flavicella sp. TaxID=2957742 RepID=UPI00301860D4
MKKKIFILIVIMMSISLVGIITVQVFWIGNAIGIREKQFSHAVNYALAKTNEQLYKKDFLDFTVQFMDLFQNKKFAKQADFTKFVYEQVNTSTNETFRFSSSGIYEETFYKGPKDFIKNDSILGVSVSSKNEVYKVKNFTDKTELSKVNQVERFTFFNNLSEIDKINIEDTYHNKFKNIETRLSEKSIKQIFSKELASFDIYLAYEFGLLDNGVLTTIKTNKFNVSEENTFTARLFTKDRHKNNYSLQVVFPKQRHYIFSDIGFMFLFSIFFTVIIMVAFASSLYQMAKQKKISLIKTDFINNMTHEFKTPIATINLALDAIKNPLIIDDNEKVMKYVKMIKEENKRMHAQVENVLRISKLEKKQIDIDKVSVDYFEILEDSISHTVLLLDDKNGEVELHCKQTMSEGLGNEFHLTNVFVNIIENAIKYSENPPKIDIFIENTVNYLTVKIKDNGIGMSKSAQKQAFDKFYREQAGNVHDVKGHGLGLAYVKEIIDNHQGKVFVESEKGKGSCFTVILPLVS